jgi:hypothetical protein
MTDEKKEDKQNKKRNKNGRTWKQKPKRMP